MMMLEMLDPSLTCSIPADTVAILPVQVTLEVEAAVCVDLAEAAHHHVLRDGVTPVLEARTALLLGPAQASGRVAVTKNKK